MRLMLVAVMAWVKDVSCPNGLPMSARRRQLLHGLPQPSKGGFDQTKQV